MSINGVAVQTLVDSLLRGEDPDPAAQERLAPLGMLRFDVWRRLAARWHDGLGLEVLGEQVLPVVLRAAAQAPDPDAAVLNLTRLQDELAGPALPRQLGADPRFAQDLLFLLGLGHLAAVAFLRQPGLTDLLLDPDALARDLDPGGLRREALDAIRRFRQPELRRNAVRRWKSAQFVRILARDFLLHRTQQTVTREISAVADACCEAALAAAAQEVLGIEPGAGPAADALGFAVVAMGKWGSWELNYNSDIDIVCVYDPAQAAGSLADWQQVVRAMSGFLGDTTPEGRLFRVDLRLRPEGASGPLVRSLESYAAYYETRGDAWEMQALTRARWCAGDAALGRRFEELATRIAYGTRVGRQGVMAIRRNRQRLDERSDADRNVKEGRGGIRDIEFTVQLLQLVRGVTDPSVRRQSTWDALEALRRAGALTEAERRTLCEAYDLLRSVEHLLQIQPTAPTKELPADAAALRRLARAMGYRSAGPLTAADRFLQAYRAHTARARELSQRLFYNPIPLAHPDADVAVQDLLDPALDHSEAARHLADIPFADPAAARRRLLFLAYGEPPMRLPENIQALFVEFLPALLACVQRMPDPDAALRWFERFVSRCGGREPFYEFVLDHPPVIELLCRVGGFSDYLSSTIVDNPEYLDLVIDQRFTARARAADDLAEELADRLAPLKSPALRLDDLRRFRRREAFRIGVRDLLGDSDVHAVTAQLSDLADVSLRTLLAEVRAQVPDADRIGFAVIGCGKLGGRELHYSSDLDVLFVYDGRDMGQEAATVAERLARKLTEEAGKRTRAGLLYPLDARLRPFGESSRLTQSLAAYDNYYQRHADVWERLVMTRARHVAGDEALGRAMVQRGQAFAYGAPPSGEELERLRHIKQRVETERRDIADDAHLDLKLAPGGIMEIEFLTQTLQIRHGAAQPAVRCANTPAALTALAAAGALTTEESERLQGNYRLFRRLETRLQLVQERPSGLLPLDDAGLTAAATRLGWSRGEAERHPRQLVADLRERLRTVREIYERQLGAES